MKRYDFHASKKNGGQFDMVISETEGEWVRYSDVKHLIETTRPEALEKSDMWWRDASRERPHPDRLVIAWTDKYGALLADRTTSNPDHGWSCDGKVTHWMPLPSVPSPLRQKP